MTASREPVWAMIPCRKGSQRIKKKNTRALPGYPGGLFEVKLRQIERSTILSGVVVSTDDPDIIDFVEAHRGEFSKEIVISERPERFAAAGPVDEFVGYIPTIMPPGQTMWLHVTSPFFGAAAIDKCITDFEARDPAEGYDSLMTVSKLQTFLWSPEGEPLFDRTDALWPQTQDLPPAYASNFAAFLAPRDVMAAHADRMGSKPMLYELSQLEAFDIDWPEDFEVAEKLFEAGVNP